MSAKTSCCCPLCCCPLNVRKHFAALHLAALQLVRLDICSHSLPAASASPAASAIPPRFLQHPCMSSISGSSRSCSTSSSGSEPLLLVETPVPLCSWKRARIMEAVWLRDEDGPRCYECLNRIDASVLPVGDRLVLLALLLMWSGQGYRFGV